MTRTRRCATVPEVVSVLAAGAPVAVIVVPGWLGSPELRRNTTRRVQYGAAALLAPVHVRWAWLREDEDGNTETAFWVWPCQTDHPAGLQCQDGRVFHGNALAGRRRS